MQFGNFQYRARRRSQQGYILLVLMLMAALVLIALSATLPSITGQLRHDREQELIHRGAQYARAIKKFYRKTGAYPVSIDQLLNTNRVRFLRKKYKDPMTGQDFRLLHLGDVQITAGAPGVSAGIAGNLTAAAASAVAAGRTGASSFGTPFGSTAMTAAPFGSQTAANAGMTAPPASVAAATGATGSTTATDSNATTGGMSSTGATPNTGSVAGTASSPSNSAVSSSGSGTLTGPTFGGGPIIGVASTSEKASFHVFNKKDHYKDWAFIYDPTQDRGALITGPYNGAPAFTPVQTSGANVLGPPQGSAGALGGQAAPSSMNPGGINLNPGIMNPGGMNPGGMSPGGMNPQGPAPFGMPQNQ